MMSGRKAFPLAIAAAATVSAAILLANRRKKKESPRKAGRTAYLHIPTANLDASAAFFRAFGLQELTSELSQDQRIFSCPYPHKLHQPYILLGKVGDKPVTGNASDAGCIGRLCLGVKDVYQTSEMLQKEYNMTPIAPPVCDRPGTRGPDNKEPKVVIVAYRDENSGAMLELVSLDTSSAMTRALVTIASNTIVQFPVFVHANVNVTNYQASLAAYQALGYTKLAKDYGRTENDFYQALKIAGPGIAEAVSLIQTPDESLFSLDLIQWQTTKKIESSNSMRVALTVTDLPFAVDEILAKEKSWTMTSPPHIRVCPAPLGKSLVAILQDPDGLLFDLVEYADPSLVPSIDVKDKLVLITGCDSGFGRTLACYMALLGFQVVAACYTSAGAEYLSKLPVTTVVADLGTKQGVQTVASRAKEVMNSSGYKLWGLVNNAGVCYPGNVDWLSPDKYNHAMQVNFIAPVSLVHEFILDLKACPGSRVINVSSVCGMLSSPTNSAYCSTKHALESFSDSLRVELTPFDVHICVVQPSTMKTPLGSSYWQNWYKGYLAASKERQASFHSDRVVDFVEGNIKVLKNVAEEPIVTTIAMAKALVEASPPTRLRTGAASNGFFRPVSNLPDSIRDNLVWSIFEFEKAHVNVQK